MENYWASLDLNMKREIFKQFRENNPSIGYWDIVNQYNETASGMVKPSGQGLSGMTPEEHQYMTNPQEVYSNMGESPLIALPKSMQYGNDATQQAIQPAGDQAIGSVGSLWNNEDYISNTFSSNAVSNPRSASSVGNPTSYGSSLTQADINAANQPMVGGKGRGRYTNQTAWAKDLSDAYRNAGVTNSKMLSMLVAQDALESGWGRSPVGDYNYGNIKVGSSNMPYKTAMDDEPVPSKFRSYESLSSYARDKVSLLKNNYDFHEGDDIETFIAKVTGANQKRKRYATSPTYDSALRNIYKTVNKKVGSFADGTDGDDLFKEYTKEKTQPIPQEAASLLLPMLFGLGRIRRYADGDDDTNTDEDDYTGVVDAIDGIYPRYEKMVNEYKDGTESWAKVPLPQRPSNISPAIQQLANQQPVQDELALRQQVMRGIDRDTQLAAQQKAQYDYNMLHPIGKGMYTLGGALQGVGNVLTGDIPGLLGDISRLGMSLNPLASQGLKDYHNQMMPTALRDSDWLERSVNMAAMLGGEGLMKLGARPAKEVVKQGRKAARSVRDIVSKGRDELFTDRARKLPITSLQEANPTQREIILESERIFAEKMNKLKQVEKQLVKEGKSMSMLSNKQRKEYLKAVEEAEQNFGYSFDTKLLQDMEAGAAFYYDLKNKPLHMRMLYKDFPTEEVLRHKQLTNAWHEPAHRAAKYYPNIIPTNGLVGSGNPYIVNLLEEAYPGLGANEAFAVNSELQQLLKNVENITEDNIVNVMQKKGGYFPQLLNELNLLKGSERNKVFESMIKSLDLLSGIPIVGTGIVNLSRSRKRKEDEVPAYEDGTEEKIDLNKKDFNFSIYGPDPFSNPSYFYRPDQGYGKSQYEIDQDKLHIDKTGLDKRNTSSTYVIDNTGKKILNPYQQAGLESVSPEFELMSMGLGKMVTPMIKKGASNVYNSQLVLKNIRYRKEMDEILKGANETIYHDMVRKRWARRFDVYENVFNRPDKIRTIDEFKPLKRKDIKLIIDPDSKDYGQAWGRFAGGNAKESNLEVSLNPKTQKISGLRSTARHEGVHIGHDYIGTKRRNPFTPEKIPTKREGVFLLDKEPNYPSLTDGERTIINKAYPHTGTYMKATKESEKLATNSEVRKELFENFNYNNQSLKKLTYSDFSDALRNVDSAYGKDYMNALKYLEKDPVAIQRMMPYVRLALRGF